MLKVRNMKCQSGSHCRAPLTRKPRNARPRFSPPGSRRSANILHRDPGIGSAVPESRQVSLVSGDTAKIPAPIIGQGRRSFGGKRRRDWLQTSRATAGQESYDAQIGRGQRRETSLAGMRKRGDFRGGVEGVTGTPSSLSFTSEPAADAFVIYFRSERVDPWLIPVDRDSILLPAIETSLPNWFFYSAGLGYSLEGKGEEREPSWAPGDEKAANLTERTETRTSPFHCFRRFLSLRFLYAKFLNFTFIVLALILVWIGLGEIFADLL